VLFAPPEQVAAEARKVLDSFGAPHRGDGRGSGHIFNLGHGISQHTPPEHVTALVEAVHSHSQSHSARKLLIHIGLSVCFFCRQISQSLDFQGSEPVTTGYQQSYPQKY
jgi:hypothetical protein